MGEIADALRQVREKSTADASQAESQSQESRRSEVAEALSRAISSDAAPRAEMEPLGAPAALASLPEVPLTPPPAAPRRPSAQAASVRPKPAPKPRKPEVVEELEPRDAAIVLDEGPSVEACRHLAVRVLAELERRSARSVAIVSAVREEGKTTAACDMSLALASVSGGRDVALVDLDLRRPSVAYVLGLRPRAGIDQYLTGSAELSDVKISIRRPAIDVYPVAEAQRSAHELLVLPRFAEMIRELEERYSVVVIDTPPTLLVPDTNLILRHAAACVAVARVGQTRARYFRKLIEMLPKRQILGELLNGIRTPSYSSSYGYYYAEEERGVLHGAKALAAVD